MICKMFVPQEFHDIAAIVGLFSDIAILILTVYTLYLTAFKRKLELVCPSYHVSAFWGESVALTISNRSLHTMPIRSVFFMKKHLGNFYMINLVSYEDPVIIESWGMKRLETEPFTSIMNWSECEYVLDTTDITRDAIIGIESMDRVLWVKPYKKAPLREARRAYKKGAFNILTVNRKKIGGKVVSQAVDCLITVRMKDVNGQCVLRTIHGITGFDKGKSVLLSDTLCGYNSIAVKKVTPDSVSESLQKLLGIEKENISVEICDRKDTI